MPAQVIAFPPRQHASAASPSAQAWRHVVAGFAQALAVEGLSPADRARLKRCHRLAKQAEGRRTR